MCRHWQTKVAFGNELRPPRAQWRWVGWLLGLGNWPVSRAFKKTAPRCASRCVYRTGAHGVLISKSRAGSAPGAGRVSNYLKARTDRRPARIQPRTAHSTPGHQRLTEAHDGVRRGHGPDAGAREGEGGQPCRAAVCEPRLAARRAHPAAPLTPLQLLRSGLRVPAVRGLWRRRQAEVPRRRATFQRHAEALEARPCVERAGGGGVAASER